MPKQYYDHRSEQVGYLCELTEELFAREISNNCPNTELRGLTWTELCDTAIEILKKIKGINFMEFLGELLRDYTQQAQEAQYSERRLNEFLKQELTPRLINVAKQGKRHYIITFKNQEFSFEELILLSQTLKNQGVQASVMADRCIKDIYYLDMGW